ncbi:MAG: cyclic nucleotide-binding domain-containing protein [Deinococcus-Thermus bacterium]|jgi:hypothetical protein|nr:cyclic nucleotide-binding domain-containing protein [Deinococcota bacterium]
MDTLIEACGWIAAALTLTAYSCRTMLPLRATAVGANVFFIAYGALSPVWPALVLHVLLLPLNAVRLWQILALRRRARAAPATEDAFGWITGLEAPRPYAAGARLFRSGDEADNIYYLVSGTVRLEEIDRTLGPGTLFGEIAFFATPRRRTATAVCETECEIVQLDEARFMAAFHQDPAFGLAIVRLVARRLIENAAAPPDREAGEGGAPQGAR